MRCTLPTLLTMFLLALPMMASAQVYKWTDANGTQHFSDAPPPQGVKYTSIHTRMDADQPREPTKAEDSSENNQQASSDDNEKARDARTQRFCAQLQSNIKLLSSSEPVQRMGSDGKTSPLDAQTRAQELQQQRKRYDAFCK